MSIGIHHIDLFIRPADVLLFRDGRPFEEGGRAEGLFPPAPVAFYGALRTAALARHGVRFRGGRLDVPDALKQELGTADTLGDMAITSFALAHGSHGRSVTPLFPMPADVLKRKGSDPASWHRMVPTDFERNAPNGTAQRVKPRTNLPDPSLHLLWKWRDERDWYEDDPGFIDLVAFADYLATGNPPAPFAHPAAGCRTGEEAEQLRKPFVTEPRTSVQIDDATQRAEDGMLYTVAFTRTNQDVGFAVRLVNAALLDASEGWLRLGGEARAARYESCTMPIFPRRQDIQQRIKATGRCTLVLVTPAPFENGWLPDGIDPKGASRLGDCSVRLVGAALGRFDTLGGWDIVRNRPRLARRAVPAGSVYFFDDVDKAAVDALFDEHTGVFGTSILNDENDKKLGLGLAYLGAWDPQDDSPHV